MTVSATDASVLARASGTTLDGAPAVSDSPMVVASVSKLLTATMVARLDQAGLVDVDAPVPWGALGLAPHPGWADVTPRELLDHTSGMPVVRRQWFLPEGDCASFLPTLLVEPPQSHRGRWTYSNGNYCALGLLVECRDRPSARPGRPGDRCSTRSARSGVHLTTGGQLPTDVGYALGVERLARLGGAGTFIVSTDDLAAVLGSVTPCRSGGDDLARAVHRPVRVGTHRIRRRRRVVRLGHGIGPHGGRRHRRRAIGREPVARSVTVSSSPLATDLGIPAGEPDRLPR